MIKYENAELEIVGFAAEDILATSTDVETTCNQDRTPVETPDEEI